MWTTPQLLENSLFSRVIRITNKTLSFSSYPLSLWQTFCCYFQSFVTNSIFLPIVMSAIVIIKFIHKFMMKNDYFFLHIFGWSYRPWQAFCCLVFMCVDFVYFYVHFSFKNRIHFNSIYPFIEKVGSRNQ